jgi:hypothetical protein
LRVKRDKQLNFDVLLGLANVLKAELLKQAQDALEDNAKHLKTHAGALQIPSDVKTFPDLENFLKQKLTPQIEDILRNVLHEAFTQR